MENQNYNSFTKTLFWCIVSPNLCSQSQFPDSTEFCLRFFKEFRDGMASEAKIERGNRITPEIPKIIGQRRLNTVILDSKYLNSSKEKMAFISKLSMYDIDTLVLVFFRNSEIDNDTIGKLVQPIKPKTTLMIAASKLQLIPKFLTHRSDYMDKTYYLLIQDGTLEELLSSYKNLPQHVDITYPQRYVSDMNFTPRAFFGIKTLFLHQVPRSQIWSICRVLDSKPNTLKKLVISGELFQHDIIQLLNSFGAFYVTVTFSSIASSDPPEREFQLDFHSKRLNLLVPYNSDTKFFQYFPNLQRNKVLFIENSQIQQLQRYYCSRKDRNYRYYISSKPFKKQKTKKKNKRKKQKKNCKIQKTCSHI